MPTFRRRSFCFLSTIVALAVVELISGVAHGMTFTTLVEFTGGAGAFRGAWPNGVTLDGAGNLFGTTHVGGANNFGTIFALSPGGGYYVLLDSTQSVCKYPESTLFRDASGNFYGTSNELGSVFEVTPAGAVTTIAGSSFSSISQPRAPVVADAAGNLYGTSSTGGANNAGTVFMVSPSGVATTLFSFTQAGSGPNNPWGGLTFDAAGNLYGMTPYGGAQGSGAVYKITPAGVMSTLVSFTGSGGAAPGTRPQEELTLGVDGNFYGTTNFGGTHDEGTVFKMTPAGAVTTLVNFDFYPSPYGYWPDSTLVQDPAGNFYGTTSTGGSGGGGTLFRMTPSGVVTVLVSFTGTAGVYKGSEPTGLCIDDAGTIYGVTTFGGAGDEGTVFMLTGAAAAKGSGSGSGGPSTTPTTPTSANLSLALQCYAAAGVAFNAGDQENGYLYLAYYYYYVYQDERVNPPVNSANMRYYYVCLGDAKFIKFANLGDYSTAYAWFEYCRLQSLWY